MEKIRAGRTSPLLPSPSILEPFRHCRWAQDTRLGTLAAGNLPARRIDSRGGLA
jgi:hypothetical protein